MNNNNNKKKKNEKKIQMTIVIWLVTLTPCRTLQNVKQTQKCVLCREYAEPNRCVLSVLQKYVNQQGKKTSNQQAKHSNCWSKPPQRISIPSQFDDWKQQCHHEQHISKPIEVDQAPKKY